MIDSFDSFIRFASIQYYNSIRKQNVDVLSAIFFKCAAAKTARVEWRCMHHWIPCFISLSMYDTARCVAVETNLRDDW